MYLALSLEGELYLERKSRTHGLLCSCQLLHIKENLAVILSAGQREAWHVVVIKGGRIHVIQVATTLQYRELYVEYLGESQLTFRRNMSLFFSACFMLVLCLAHSSTLKMEATCSSETSADFRRSTRHYIPEDSNIHDHRCENFRVLQRYSSL
jgi:hypothetical protein